MRERHHNTRTEVPDDRSRRQLSWVLAFCFGASFGLADALMVAVRPASGATGAGFVFALWAYTLPLFLLASLLVAVLLRAGRALVVAIGATVDVRVMGATSREMLLGLGPPSGLAFGLVYRTALYFAVAFHNHELASALVATLVVGYAGATVLGWYAVVRGLVWLRHKTNRVKRNDAGIAAWLLALGVPGAVLMAVLIANREGLRIVGVAMLFAPALAALVLPAAWFALRRCAAPRVRASARAAWVASAAMIPVAVALGFTRPELADHALDASLWSGRVLRVAQAVTDVDRDGDSSLFGGGDCAPWNSAIGPTQREIPGDGLDNNCRRGDLVPSLAERKPTWHSLPPEYEPPRDLIVITVEALRHDVTSLPGGSARATTPRLAELGKRAVVFDRFYATAPQTREALSAIWTTQIPSETTFEGPRDREVIAARNPWVPEILRASGFHTTAILTDFEYFTGDQNIGFQRGFDEYDVSARVARIVGQLWGFPAKEMIDKAITTLDAHRDRRHLLWMHLVEPHAKYEQYPGAPVFGASNFDLYASEVWGVDQQIGRLVDQLVAWGRLDSTAIVVVGDHGEAFGEEGREYHGTALSEAQTHVAAVLHVPGVPPGVISMPASQQDIGSSILNLLGVRTDFDALSGRNLTPLLFGAEVDYPPIFLGLYGNSRVFGPETKIAVLEGPYKLVATRGGRRTKLYDVVKDPREAEPLAPRSVPRFDFLDEIADFHLDRAARRGGSK